MPQPLGYYGLNLDISTEIEIDNLHLHELTNLLKNTTTTLNNKHYIDNEEAPCINEEYLFTGLEHLSDIEKIGAIRGLCDRIELKLMEAAK